MNWLEEKRKEIDTLDQTIVAALEQRMTLSRAIGKQKRAEGQAVYDPARETHIIQKCQALLKNQEFSREIEAIYREILEQSRGKQSK